MPKEVKYELPDEFKRHLEDIAIQAGTDPEKLKQLATEAGPGIKSGDYTVTYADGRTEVFHINNDFPGGELVSNDALKSMVDIVKAGGSMKMLRSAKDDEGDLWEDEDDDPADKRDLEFLEGGKKQPKPDESPYVLNMDSWGERRGKELCGEWRREGGAKTLHSTFQVAADAHASLFEPNPTFAENPKSPDRAAWWKQMMETPDFQALHNETCLNTNISAIAAKTLFDQWAEYAKTNPPPGEGSPAPGSDQEPIENAMNRIASTVKALKEASQSVQDAKDVMNGMGIGEANSQLSPKQIKEYFKKVRSNDQLLKIMRMAGRMRLLSQALQRTKTVHGRDDVVGVELGKDVERLVPSELGQLACGIPEIELLALDRIARGQALCRQYRGKERLGRGPIVVCVDESGSMQGDRIVAAKALALALADLARRQKRWIGLVAFSGTKTGAHVAFPPGAMDQDVLLRWLEKFRSGGTVLDVPLATMPFQYWPHFLNQGLVRGKTDVIIITDAQVTAPEEMKKNYRAWAKKEQVSTYGIVVGETDAGDLAQVCDRYWCVPSLDLDSKAVEGVLSI